MRRVCDLTRLLSKLFNTVEPSFAAFRFAAFHFAISLFRQFFLVIFLSCRVCIAFFPSFQIEIVSPRAQRITIFFSQTLPHDFQ